MTFVAIGLLLSAVLVRETSHLVAHESTLHRALASHEIAAAIYPATWGIGPLFTGAWSDRVGRKWLIACGMWVQAVGIAVVITAAGFAGFAAGGWSPPSHSRPVAWSLCG